MESEKRVLCIGLVCYDLVSVVDHFPIEDKKIRTQQQRRSRGGNASNMTTVLSHLNVPCEFLGSMPSDTTPELTFVEEDFKLHKIPFAKCPRHQGHLLPNSCVILNNLSGSRTNLHTNDGLPELRAENSSSINMQHYNWIHIEGRQNAKELTKIAKMVKDKHPNIPISLEIEQPSRAHKDSLFKILPHIDLLFISKEVASSLGASSMKDAVYLLQDLLPLNACIVCPWGEKGACVKDAKGSIFEVPCYPPPSGIRYSKLSNVLKIAYCRILEF